MLSNFNEQIVRNRPLCTLFLKVDLRYTCATLLCVLGVAGGFLDFHFSCLSTSDMFIAEWNYLLALTLIRK